MSQTQSINPLLFMPSPRDIPAVKRLWHILPHDKFIVKYTPQQKACTLGKEFFLKHNEYTHFIICCDDLEVTVDGVQQFLDDIIKYNYETISGICNIDETQPNTYAIQPLGCDYSKPHPVVHKGAWYMKDEKPILPTGKDIIEVGYAGFPCQVISRKLMKQVSWVGASNGGNFDWQFSKDCHKLGIPIMCDLRVKLWHRRQEQWARVREYKTSGFPEGYSFLLKAL